MARIDGRVVFAPFTLPGEVAKIEARKADIHAEWMEVVSARRERVAPRVLYLSVRRMSVSARALRVSTRAQGRNSARATKAASAKSNFRRDRNHPRAESLLPNRAQFHLENGKIGYLAAGSHDLIPVDGGCPISSPRLNQALAEMRERMKDKRFPNFVHTLELFTDETALQVNVIETERPVAQIFYQWCGSTLALDYTTAHGKFRVSPRSFFQVNRFLIDALIDIAVGEAEGATALDLYAGVGLFALPLSKKFAKVWAVEGGVTAARDLEANAKAAGLAVRSIQARVEEHLERVSASPDYVVADPPRAGLGKAVVGHYGTAETGQVDHRFLRSGDAGQGRGGAEELRHRKNHFSRPFSADVSYGNGSADEPALEVN